MLTQNLFRKWILKSILIVCYSRSLQPSGVLGAVKQVVLNVVKGFLIFLEGYPFLVIIGKGASWPIHLHFLFSDFFQHEGLLSSPSPRCSLDSSRTFSHPYFCRGRVELILVKFLASRVRLECQIFLHLIKDETRPYSFCGGEKM